MVKELHQANYGVYGGARCGMLWLEFRPAVGMIPISLDEPVAGTCRLLQCEEIAIQKLQDVGLRAIVDNQAKAQALLGGQCGSNTLAGV